MDRYYCSECRQKMVYGRCPSCDSDKPNTEYDPAYKDVKKTDKSCVICGKFGQSIVDRYSGTDKILCAECACKAVIFRGEKEQRKLLGDIARNYSKYWLILAKLQECEQIRTIQFHEKLNAEQERRIGWAKLIACSEGKIIEKIKIENPEIWEQDKKFFEYFYREEANV